MIFNDIDVFHLLSKRSIFCKTLTYDLGFWRKIVLFREFVIVFNVVIRDKLRWLYNGA
jgi:hypothetical protein